jgi:hypothetical protein
VVCGVDRSSRIDARGYRGRRRKSPLTRLAQSDAGHGAPGAVTAFESAIGIGCTRCAIRSFCASTRSPRSPACADTGASDFAPSRQPCGSGKSAVMATSPAWKRDAHAALPVDGVSASLVQIDMHCPRSLSWRGFRRDALAQGGSALEDSRTQVHAYSSCAEPQQFARTMRRPPAVARPAVLPSTMSTVSAPGQAGFRRSRNQAPHPRLLDTLQPPRHCGNHRASRGPGHAIRAIAMTNRNASCHVARLRT